MLGRVFMLTPPPVFGKYVEHTVPVFALQRRTINNHKSVWGNSWIS
jgi:hypothetical protein